MAWEPENRRQNGAYAGDYTAEEAAVVDQAKRVHKETTASAQRALKVRDLPYLGREQTAERTRELAANTMAELDKQGQKLDTINKDLNEIDADVLESRSVLSYMRRCCCCFLCSCCCDGDTDVTRDNTRKQRVRMRKEMRSSEKALTSTNSGVQGAATQPSGSVAANGRALAGEQGARDELFERHAERAGEAARRQQRRVRNGAHRIGENLRDADREEVQAETELQEQALDQIGAALGDMHRLTQDMGEELREQEAKIGQLEDKTGKTQDNLASLSTSAKKDFRLRGKSVNSGPSASRMITKAAARALS